MLRYSVPPIQLLMTTFQYINVVTPTQHWNVLQALSMRLAPALVRGDVLWKMKNSPSLNSNLQPRHDAAPLSSGGNIVGMPQPTQQHVSYACRSHPSSWCWLRNGCVSLAKWAPLTERSSCAPMSLDPPCCLLCAKLILRMIHECNMEPNHNCDYCTSMSKSCDPLWLFLVFLVMHWHF